MTPEQREQRETREFIYHRFYGEGLNSVQINLADLEKMLDALIAKAFLAGEKSGKGKSLDDIWSNADLRVDDMNKAVQDYKQILSEKILAEKKYIGFEEGQETTTFTDEINAMAYETKAEAWFAGWDQAVDKFLMLLETRTS